MNYEQGIKQAQRDIATYQNGTITMSPIQHLDYITCQRAANPSRMEYYNGYLDGFSSFAYKKSVIEEMRYTPTEEDKRLWIQKTPALSEERRAELSQIDLAALEEALTVQEAGDYWLLMRDVAIGGIIREARRKLLQFRHAS